MFGKFAHPAVVKAIATGVAGISLTVSTAMLVDDSDVYLAMMNQSNAAQRYAAIWEEEEDFDSPEGEETEAALPPQTSGGDGTGTGGGGDGVVGDAIDWNSADGQAIQAWLSPYGIDLSKLTVGRFKVLKAAMGLLGIPYSQNRAGFDNLGKRPSALDCSSFVWRCYAEASMDMAGFPTNTGAYSGSTAVARVPWSSLVPGDILCRRSGNSGHATIFLGVVNNIVYTVEETQTGDCSRIVQRNISKVNTSEDPNSGMSQLSAFQYQKFPAASSSTGSTGGSDGGTAVSVTSLIGGNMTAYEKEQIKKWNGSAEARVPDKGHPAPDTGVGCAPDKITYECRNAIHSGNNYALSHGTVCTSGDLAGKTFYLDISSSGLLRANGRVCVAVGSGYMKNIGVWQNIAGNPLLIIFSDGKVLRAVNTDGKADCDTNQGEANPLDNHKFQHLDGSVVEAVSADSGNKSSVLWKRDMGVSDDAEAKYVIALPMSEMK